MRKRRPIAGKRLGVGMSALKANAAMCSLEHRLTGEDYRQYVKRLAVETGVDPEDPSAVVRFDMARPNKKMASDEWLHPHDPDAKVDLTKQGRSRGFGEVLPEVLPRCLICGTPSMKTAIRTTAGC